MIDEFDAKTLGRVGRGQLTEVKFLKRTEMCFSWSGGTRYVTKLAILAQAILAQAISCSNGSLLSRGPSVCLLVCEFCFSVRRSMPRKGWTQVRSAPWLDTVDQGVFGPSPRSGHVRSANSQPFQHVSGYLQSKGDGVNHFRLRG